MRAAHSLKGAARIVGLDAAVRVAHAMEDCFVAAQKGKVVLQPEHVDILLKGVDLLIQIAQVAESEIEAWQAEHAVAIDALVADLTAVQAGMVVSQRAPAPVRAEVSHSSQAASETILLDSHDAGTETNEPRGELYRSWLHLTLAT